MLFSLDILYLFFILIDNPSLKLITRGFYKTHAHTYRCRFPWEWVQAAPENPRAACGIPYPYAVLGNDNNRLVKPEAIAHQQDQMISSWG